MALFRAERLTALPGSPTANTIYIVNPPGEDDYCEVYVTGNSGSTIRRIIREEDVENIVNAVVSSFGLLHIVADITARDALDLAGKGNAFVLVEDASADATVDSGAALYAFKDADDSFVKLTEYESLDITVSWADINGKPSSSTADIDDAVSKKHEHANMTQLSKIGESAGRLTYDGAISTIDWTNVEW